MSTPRLRHLALLLAPVLALSASCRGHAAATGSTATAQASGAAAAASSTATTGTPLPTDPSLIQGRLDNGLTYYVLRNAKPEKRAQLWLAVNAGSVLEDDDQQGLAHFIEHMCFNGTKKYAKQQIVNWLEKIGMRFGPDINAFTSFDETVFQIEVPTDDPKVVEHGLDVLHEWAQGVAFDPTEVNKERGVVLEERRLGRGAQGRLLDKLIPGALPGSRYGQRIPIGKENILKTATADTLKRFYHDWYRPDLMAVIVVGDLDAAQAEKLIKAHFADLKGPASEKPRPDVPVPPQDKTITLSVKDPELPVTVVAVASKQPHRVVRSEADLRAELTDELFVAMLNQRLEELAKKPDAPFLAAGVGKQAIFRPIDVWFQGAVVKGDKAAQTLELLSKEAARVAKFGFTDTEVARAKHDLLHRFEVSAAEKDKTESRDRVQEIVRVFLTGEAIPGPVAELALAKKLVPSITAADIQAVAARAASAKNRLVIAAANSKTSLPAEGALVAAVDKGRAEANTAYVDNAVKGPLVAKPPAPGTIKKEHDLKELGVTEWTLSNGIRVVLKPTTFKNDQVVLAGFSLGGISMAGRGADLVAARSADDLAAAGGAGELSAIQIEKALSGTGVGLDVSFGPLDQEVSGAAQPDHLQQLLQLLYLRLTEPRLDETATQAWLAQQVEGRKNQLDDPGTVFRKRFTEVATGKSPLFRLLTSDDFAKLDVKRALDFYRHRFAHLGGLTFVMVGSFKVDEVKPLILTYLGGLPATGKPEHWHKYRLRRPHGAVKFEVDKGIEPKSAVHLLFHRRARWSREDAHNLRSLASALSIRLREELREDMSGTYGVRVVGEWQREPTQEATLDISFGCAPENTDKLIAAAMEVMADFKKNGPPEAVVEKIKQGQRRGLETALQNNGFWLDRLLQSYRYGDDPRQILKMEQLIDQVSAARLKAAARRYLGRDYVLGVLKPADSDSKTATQPKAASAAGRIRAHKAKARAAAHRAGGRSTDRSAVESSH